MRRSPLTPYPSTRAVAAEQRGAKTKKKREIGLLHAGMVWLACRLALEGDGISGPMGSKSIASYLNKRRIFHRSRRQADPMSSRNGSAGEKLATSICFPHGLQAVPALTFSAKSSRYAGL
jgi:hypothetical protein